MAGQIVSKIFAFLGSIFLKGFTRRLKFLSVFIICAAIILTFSKNKLDRFELITLDWRFKLRPQTEEESPVVIIEIAEDSLTSLGRWPFDRKYHALLIRTLKEAGAKAVVFDILFSESSISDDKLIEETRQAGNVFYPVAFEIFKGVYSKRIIAPLLQSLQQTAAGWGHINVVPDIDGKIRRVPLLIKYNDIYVPHLSLRAALDYLGKEFDAVWAGKSVINIGHEINIPCDEEGLSFINYTALWGKDFKHYSYLDVLRSYNQIRNNETPILNLPAVFKDKICLVGLTATGTHDLKPTPLENSYPMIGIHAQIINSLLRNNFLRRLEQWQSLFLQILLVLAVLFILRRCTVGAGLLLFIGVVSIWIVSAVFVFILRGIWIDIVFPILTAILLYAAISVYKFMITEREKRWIKKAFSNYVCKEVMEEILKNPSKLKLGGEKRELTVLFSDIRSFTSYSERHKPEEVVDILNEYLSAMTKVVFDNHGTLDKYIGDAIMAIFGAPHYETPQVSAEKAIVTACKMMEKLKQLQKKWAEENKEPFDIGIGINTGDMVVGNMGSDLLMDYTVIGDAVNLGSRVEALTRKYDNHIIITEYTYNYVKDIVEVKPLESIKVKGKEIAVMVYEVLKLKSGEIIDGA